LKRLKLLLIMGDKYYDCWVTSELSHFRKFFFRVFVFFLSMLHSFLFVAAMEIPRRLG